MTENSDRWRRFERSSDAYLLTTLILLLLIVAPILTSDFPYLESVLTAILVGAVVTLSMASSNAPRWAIRASWISSILVLASVLFDTATEVRVVGVVVLAALLIASPIVILRRVGAHREVTATTIWGAISAYLAFGMAFSLMYAAIVSVDPAAFNNMTAGGLGDPNYFSFVTMTTLGYGDIAPVEDLPRALVVFQTLIGQIYLIVVVARVVSMLGKPNEKLRHDPGE